MSDPILDVTALRSGYGRVPVLHDITFSIAERENIGLIGPNGHGKTTLFRTLSGLVPAWSGSVRFLGEDITRKSPASIVERGLIHAPQGNKLFPDFTVLENLWLGAFVKGPRAQRKRTIEQVFSIFPRLAERRGQRCSTLSGGERQMVTIGCGLMGLPKMLILDEPTLGLSPKLKAELRDAIETIVASGVQTVIVEQDPEFLQTLTTRLLLVSEGVVRAEIADSGGLEHQRIVEMYFGHA
ncbi:ABC transporter ATP-binding protein [Aquamicrobium sp. NLF2-7]|uniref:ABC transporter ATP-binding protein n=1 Tax=Aquamicrobium sp. NLF2-7 TaxID=2918753 RepID=UPI001EFAA2BA|nr:ABC transporter ATP-binding protein [Aquamicrobium sp. NLF2-7]MCG8274576.1 ABC transporter ATP-binding protein [Aquamicrobium sp. NLF2-7]